MARYLLSRRPATIAAAAAPGALRRAGAALVAALLLGVGAPAWALGLGEIELNSALNEKLDANIELLDSAGLQPTEVIVSLASADDFERVGVERFFFLTDLRFEVAFTGDRIRGIEVSSTQPVTEPYLNFLVEVLWPNGRLLKEYTLLLDPPTFSPAAAPTVSAPSQSAQRDGGAGRVARSAPATAGHSGTEVNMAPGRGRQPSPLDEGVVDGEYRMTDRNDTLWTIAMRTRASAAVSVKQNMLAIQRLNPEAFLNDNINLLKAGYRLRLPTEAQALSTGSAEAERQVALQNEDWKALRRGETPPPRSDAGERQVASASADAEPSLQAQVDATPARPAAATPGAATDGELRIVAGSGDSVSGTAAVSAEQLNAAMEERDRLSREVDSLTEQLGREKELAGNQIAVKERQIEVKDQQIAEMQAQIESLREEMEPAAAAPPQSQNQNASVSQPWWQSPWVLGGAVGVVVLLLVYALVAARRRRAEADAFYPEVAEAPAFAATPGTPEQVAAVATGYEAEDLLEDEEDEPVEIAVVQPGTSAAADEEAGSEAGDVIGEADIYIAYGRYPQAIGLLLGVLEEDPGRNDVRLKLLELYAETRDREAFDVHMATLLERCDDDEALLTARELAAQFSGAESTEAPSVAAPALEVDDGPAALDELAGEAPAGEQPAAGAAVDDAGEAPGEEFELELDEIAATHDGKPGDDLGGDLGIDFDPDHGNGTGPNDLDDLTEVEDLADVQELADGELKLGGDDLDLDLDLDDVDALGDDAFDFGDDADTASTKLDLARAYIDMGDQDGARDILNEVVAEGSNEQQQRAQAMLEEL